MVLEKLRYRVYDFGTIVLPDAVRRSAYCALRVSVLSARSSYSQSFERIPPQSSWGYVVLLDADGFAVGRELEVRFAKQRWVLWEYPEDVITQNICVLGNNLYGDIMTELAKKPNIPPLPPSTPPLPGGTFQNTSRLVAHGVEMFTVRSRFVSDLDVELWYTSQPESDCTPVAIDPPAGQPPIEQTLPQPGGPNGNGPAPLQQVPVLGQVPALGGTSLIPPGFPPGYQSELPNVPEYKRVTVRWEGVNPCNLPCSQRAIVNSFFYVPYGDGTEVFSVALGTAPAPCNSRLGFSLSRLVSGTLSVVGTGPATGIFTAAVVAVTDYSGPPSPAFAVVFNPCP